MSGWFRGLLWLLWSDFNRGLRAPVSLYAFLGTVAFLGFTFWLFATFAVVFFLDFAYFTLPIFFLALAATLISRDRETGFSGILYTHPISDVQYYLAKFLGLQLLAGVYLLTLVPFNLVIVQFAGPGWMGELLARAGWTLLITSFAVALGLLISASLGRRATVPSVSVGFSVGIALVAGPFLIIQYLGAFGPELSPRVLALLHVSPVMGALDTFRSHGLLISDPLQPILLSASLSLVLLAAGLAIYTRLQSPEGWESSSAVRVGSILLVVTVLVGSSLAIPFEYEMSPMIGSRFFDFGDVDVFVGGIAPVGGRPLVGTTFEARLSLTISNPNPEAATLGALTVRWYSEYLQFNVTSAHFGPLILQALDHSVLEIPLQVVALRIHALGASEFVTQPSVLIEFEAPDFTHLYEVRLRIVGPDYHRDSAWLIVAFLVLVAISMRTLGHVRSRHT